MLQLTRERLAGILGTERLDDQSLSRWIDEFRAELGTHGFLPDGICMADPRTGDRVVFNAARAKRPLDNRTDPGSDQPPPPCIVCNAKLTRVVDVADLSEGFTLINKNLYPVVFPGARLAGPEDPAAMSWGASGVDSYGLHLLQWTSSLHELDWHNMPSADRVVVTKRLAALERKLLEESAGLFPSARCWGGPSDLAGYVQIIKNSGAPVGGSVYHGHQQIILSNVMPRKTRDDWEFAQRTGTTFAEHMLSETPEALVIRDYGPAVLVVPYFMRRPYDMLLVFCDCRKRFLFELDEDEIVAWGDGWHDGIRLMRSALTSIGRHVAYNIVVHTGAGAGIYVEFLPYSQEVGGYEQAGFWSCQAAPTRAAEELRTYAAKD